MGLVFCGTPQFAVPTLNALVDAGHRIKLVVCQPDRPSGRSQQLAVPAVKQRALELGLRLAQPEKIKNNPEFRAELEALKPKAIIVVAYGRIIPKWMLDLPALGNINLHASLLPKHRGAAPIQWAIANGEQVTGATTMLLEEGLDTGPILLQRALAIGPDETAAELSPRLASAGAELMVETLRRLEAGTLKPTPQEDAKATLAPLLKKGDGLIDFSRPSQAIYDRLRGFTPWPGAFTSFRGKKLQVLRAQPLAAAEELTPAGRIRLLDHRLIVGCGQDTSLELLEVQPEGKRSISAGEFISGYRPKGGEALGS
ncbi:MAG TPA: methionyl-tRNA formyltransferase [Terriglobales bacterium]|nr:methionyl-tRNA formyltransferase [Terriglobales bacterium]